MHVWDTRTFDSVFASQGKFEEAEELYRRSLDIREKALGPDHPKVATSLNNLAECLKGQVRTAGQLSKHYAVPDKCFRSRSPTWECRREPPGFSREHLTWCPINGLKTQAGLTYAQVRALRSLLCCCVKMTLCVVYSQTGLSGGSESRCNVTRSLRWQRVAVWLNTRHI